MVNEVLVFLAVLTVGALIYRAIVALERSSGAALRTTEKERRDMFQLFEKLVEKRDNPHSPEVLDAHTHERVRKQQLDASVDRSPAPPVYPPNIEGAEATLEEAIS